MSDSIKNDKDFIIAKMNHRNSMITASIAGFVSLISVIIPTYLINANKTDSAEKSTEVSTNKEVAPTTIQNIIQSQTPTPTPTEEKKGKGKGD